MVGQDLSMSQLGFLNTNTGVDLGVGNGVRCTQEKFSEVTLRSNGGPVVPGGTCRYHEECASCTLGQSIYLYTSRVKDR